MKIALLGYGKMGKTIEKIALQRGHKIVLKTNHKASNTALSKADVAIDFSIPSEAFNNIKACIDNQIPVVSGTTGWLDQYNEMVSYCNLHKGTFIYASNFSLGVNIFFEINKKLAQTLQPLKQYSVAIEEIHHTQKLDTPSGTAITLVNQILEYSTKKQWHLKEALSKKDSEGIEITAKRIENVPGTHTVKYTSNEDTIEIKHTAHNRNGFALGAVIAAEWLQNKQGVFTMKDVLEI